MRVAFGIVRTWDETNYLAGVELLGSLGSYLPAVPVAWHVDPDWMTAGTRCVLLVGDLTNPSMCVLVACYDGAPPAVELVFA
jgi:hypothetical protein